jgi:tryptophan 2,3-dioxygenase
VRAVRSWTAGLLPGFVLLTDIAPALAAHGTGALPRELKAAFSEAAGAIASAVPRPGHRVHSQAENPEEDTWIVAGWLTAADAMCSGHRTYETYTLCDLFDAHCAGAPEDGGHQRRAQVLAALLTADLVRHELTSPRSTARTTAVSRLAGDLAMTLAPTARRRRPTPPAALRLAREVTAQLCAGGPPTLRTLVTCPPLVTTTESDEYLFIRSVQIMEILTLAAAHHAEEASRQCQARNLDGVPAPLHGIEDCLTAATRLFPVLSTLDTVQFARIREATHGTGALQSPGFAALERTCRGTHALRPETLAGIPLHRSQLPGTPLSAALSALLSDTAVGTASAAAAAGAADAVDRAWIRWKRAHHSITRRVIGDVPGTGGSEGVAYLGRHRNTPLLASP